MSLVRIYLYSIGQKVVIPEMVETGEGVIIERGPVKVFDLHQLPEWKALVYTKLSQGNPLIPTPEVSDEPGSAVLDKLGLQKWSDFERYAIMYTIHKGARFTSVYTTGRNPDGTWTQGTKERHFESRAPLELVIDEVASDLVKEPEAVARPTTLLLGGSQNPAS